MLARLRGIFGNRPYLYGVLAGFAMFVAVYVLNAVMAPTPSKDVCRHIP
jgi:hypothetical protein